MLRLDVLDLEWELVEGLSFVLLYSKGLFYNLQTESCSRTKLSLTVEQSYSRTNSLKHPPHGHGERLADQHLVLRRIAHWFPHLLPRAGAGNIALVSEG